MSQNNMLRDRSGNVISSNPWAGLLYDLIKYGSPPMADLETYVRQNINLPDETRRYQFTNGYIANYALDIVQRMEEAKLQDVTFIAITMDRQYQADLQTGKSAHDAMKHVVASLLAGKF